MGGAILRTPRLTLRPPRPEDAPALLRGLNDAGVARMLTRPPFPYRAADASAFLADCAARAGAPRWIVDDGAPVGLIALDPHLGYWLDRAVWGRGYATEAGWAVLRHAFADPERAEIASGHFLENDASAAVLRRLGFVETGRRPVFSAARGAEVLHADMVLTRAAWAAAEDWRIETDRLVVAPHRPEDAPALAALGNDPAVARMLTSVPLPFSEADALRRILRSRHRGAPGFRAGIRLRDGTLIGEIGLGPDRAAGEVPERELGYWLGVAHHRRGYGREAVAAFVADARRRFGPARLLAEVWEDNAASMRLLESLGFARAGETVDTSALRPEPTRCVVFASPSGPGPTPGIATTPGAGPANEAAERAMS